MFHQGYMSARAVINFRVLPGDTRDGIQKHVERVIDDPRVKVTRLPRHRAPSTVSRVDSPEYQTLRVSIREVFPEAIVTPYLVVGGTDARHYMGLSENVYRFLPVHLSLASRSLLHGRDERLSVAGLEQAVGFYDRVIRRGAGSPS